MSDVDDEIGEISLKNEGVTIEWTIENFLSYTEEDKSYFSPNFSIPGSEWYLNLYPKGESDDDSEGWIGLYLCREGDLTYPKSADYSFGVKRVDGTIEKKNVCKRMYDTYVFRNGVFGCWSGIPNFLQRSELERRKSEMLPSGSLTITCTLRVNDCLDAISNLMKLSKDFDDMLKSERCSDAALNVRHHEFKIHKAVLESRSPVFESMFEIDMKEKKTGVVEIVDCDPGVFEDFLAYLYTGKFENSAEKDFDLYRIADKYAVEELKLECVRSMLSDLSIDNLFDVAHLAHQFDEQELKSKTQEFFDQNFTKIAQNAKWNSVLDENSQLAKELLKNMAINMENQRKVL